MTTTMMIPSWTDLESKLLLHQQQQQQQERPLVIDSALQQNNDDADDAPSDNNKPTLYRERHGWCPYSERVWLTLEYFQVDYDTVLIDNTGHGPRPSYYTGQTPQIRWPEFHSEKRCGESLDLMRDIDNRYSSSSLLSLYSVELEEEIQTKIAAFRTIFPSRARPSSRAAFLFQYNGEPLSRSVFESTLQQTDDLLRESGGPFFCGSRLTAVDLAWCPFLERYAAQLPCLHDQLYPRSELDYPYLYAWYNAMDYQALLSPYSSHVRGHESSWRKVLTMAGYGNAGNVPLDIEHRMQQQGTNELNWPTEEEYQKRLNIWAEYAKTRPYVASSPSSEAASIVLRNQFHIQKDIMKRLSIHKRPSSLMTLLTSVQTKDDGLPLELDAALRAMTHLLLLMDNDDDTTSSSILRKKNDNDNYVKEIQSLVPILTDVVTFLDERMCIPRDMNYLSASCIKQLLGQLL